MSLPHGLLGLLTYSDSTGYDLSKLFKDSLNFFWNAPTSQIYRELGRMEKAGLVSSRSIVQDGRPNKRLYSITPAGRDEFSRWLTDFQYTPVNCHNAFLMRIFFGAETDAEHTIRLLESFRQQCEAELASLQSSAFQNIDMYGKTVPNGELKKGYWKATVDGGIIELKGLIEWAESSIKSIRGSEIT